MRILISTAIILSVLNSVARTGSPELWYKKPAKTWTEALPVGNGRLGGMVYGDYLHENIQLNEESVWAGTKMNNNNPGAKEHLGEIRQAIDDFTHAIALSPDFFESYLRRGEAWERLGDHAGWVFVRNHEVWQ